LRKESFFLTRETPQKEKVRNVGRHLFEKEPLFKPNPQIKSKWEEKGLTEVAFSSPAIKGRFFSLYSRQEEVVKMPEISKNGERNGEEGHSLAKFPMKQFCTFPHTSFWLKNMIEEVTKKGEEAFFGTRGRRNLP